MLSATEQAAELIATYGNDAYKFASNTFDNFHSKAVDFHSKNDINSVLDTMYFSSYWLSVCIHIVRTEKN